ncbi:MAG: 2'-5' RNA ligase family protein [Candidatus Gracilibacteria bacterium]|nr:2'-5' RNA ligase family protein [Candidatus Gracilibacteria bacterium]
MQTTSHFIGIELKSELFSDLFVKIYNYIKENNIEKSILFQNPLSPHITLYYLEKDIDNKNKEEIKEYIKNFEINDNIKLTGFNYFFRGEGNRFVLYFNTNTNLPLKKYRDFIHEKYNRDYVEDNSFTFSPHITFLRIQDSIIFENHRENIENIINDELKKISELDINTKNIYLYAVNSKFKEEIQIKL